MKKAWAKRVTIGITSLAAVIIFLLATLSLAGCPTDLLDSEVINIADIEGVTAPVTGGTPVTVITPTDQYTGTVTWKSADGAALTGEFAASTIYTATIILKAETGYILKGVPANFFNVKDAAATNAANSGIITAVFPSTGGTASEPVVIDQKAVEGVTVPVVGGIPVTVIPETGQYTGTVTWAPTVTAGGTFAESTAYTATITLTPKTGYTLEGVDKDFFTVTGATAANAANSGVITAVFPATAKPAVISIAAITGVTAPVVGGTPVKVITATDQYTGTVEWNGNPTIFAPTTVYTATITLTAKPGYTLQGVGANFFTVAGTSTPAANAADSGVITAVFPATAQPTVINIAAIQGVTAPVAGGTPVTAITASDQYTGTVEWNGNPTTFAAATAYTATITLTAKPGYTLQGVGANFFTVAGTSTPAANSANSGSITAVFPKTDTTITLAAIGGVTVPVTGGTPAAAITETAQYTGTVTWNPNVAAGGTFAVLTVYNAIITITPKTGYTLQGVPANFFTVAGASAPAANAANSGTITVLFPKTAPSAANPIKVDIKNIELTGPPVTGADQGSVDVKATEQFTGSILWSPVDPTFLKTKPYTAKITLSAITGYTFAGVGANYFTVTVRGTTITGATNPAGTDTTIDITVPFTVSDGIVDTTDPIVISFTDGAAAKLTVPVNGKPVPKTIDAAAQYTGTVGWSYTDKTTATPSVKPFSGANFGGGTEYTAKITLTAKPGYNFTGVATNSFTVQGATVGETATSVTVGNPSSNGASIDITVVYNETEPTVINNPDIAGVVFPVAGKLPQGIIPAANSSNPQFTAEIRWSITTAFVENEIYGAQITVTPKPGYTLKGVAKDAFKVTDADTSNDADSGIVNVVFPPTGTTEAPIIVFIAAIGGITAPVTGGTPVKTITETTQYTGTVVWNGDPTTFASNVEYTATITLTEKTGYTFTGVRANFFTVEGTSPGTTENPNPRNSVNSNVITAKFPKTATTINIAAIGGVTAPATGATPVTAITETAQYTGTVAWKTTAGVNLTGNFAATTNYTATIILAAKPNYTLTGVPSPFFTVQGATSVTYVAGSNTVTAVFPATGQPIVDIAAIAGVTAPATNGTPAAKITDTAQYTGTVTWKTAAGANLTGNFAASTSYTATITLTARGGYTLQGVGANFFTVAGATATNPINSGVITAVFPATADTTVTIKAIEGVTAPATNGSAAPEITETTQYTGTVAWAPNNATFAQDTQYTATIILTAKTGYTFTGITATNFFTITGATSVSNPVGNGTSIIITAVFPKTAATINIAAIGGVTAPVTLGTPVTKITDPSPLQYTGTVTWNPALTTDGKFRSDVTYTATITLTEKPGFTFSGVTSPFFTVAGATTVTYNAGSNSISAVFPKTAATINIAAIGGVTAPATGATPVTAITEADQYTGTIAWNGNPTTFAADTQYTATITLTEKSGFTFTGVASPFFTVAGATTVTYVAGSKSLTAVFPKTDKTVTTKAILGVTVPATGGTPVSAITEDAQYTGTVTWKTATGADLSGNFEAATAYTATITLTAKAGFTLYGVTSPFFTVAGATATNAVNSGVITAVFPAAAP